MTLIDIKSQIKIFNKYQMSHTKCHNFTGHIANIQNESVPQTDI